MAGIHGSDERVSNDPMEAIYIGFNMWVEAVTKARTTESDAVVEVLVGISVPDLSDGLSSLMSNPRIFKPVLIGYRVVDTIAGQSY